MSTLELHKLNKSFGKRQILHQLSHTFDIGSHALQAPNGMGKSTLLAIVAGVVSADSGEIEISGRSLRHEPVLARQQLAWVPDKAELYDFLSPAEFIAFVAQVRACGVESALQAAEALGLSPWLDQRMNELSLGNQRKALLATSFISDVALLLIDEPTNALDKQAKQWLAQALHDMAQTRCVLFSSHDQMFCEAAGAQVWQFSAAGLGK